MSPHSNPRSSVVRRAVVPRAVVRRAAARWGISLVPFLVLAGLAVQVAAGEPPEDGGYCSTTAQDVRRADLAFERGGLPVVTVTERRCQR